ncbi:MAG: recombinase family protein, partial [Bdellovibrionota bacterium]
SERVSANFQARAARGLYNGGVLPLGYKLITDKPGFLDVDTDASETVKLAFKAFLNEGTLSLAAKWLNSSGHNVKREMSGGNHRPRLGHFTVDNLHQILRNRSYIALRQYKLRGELKETKAAWPAIIDIEIFDRVQKQLKANHCRKKPAGGNRFPFLLTGLVRCASCNERMVGKSAHGNGGKIPYYEHGWATKKQGCLVKPVFNCKPFRIQAKKLEPVIWEKVQELLSTPCLVEDLVEGAQKLHREKSKTSETKRIQEKIRSIEGQIEVLASRLAELPKSVSPTPVFKQMEKLEQIKAEEQARLAKAQLTQITGDVPASLKKYEAFLKGLRMVASLENTEAVREKIIRALVSRILITPEGFEVEFHAGKDYVEWEMAMQEEELPKDFDVEAGGELLMFRGSNSLTNGGHCRD